MTDPAGDEEVLSPAWRAWVVENLARGASTPAVVDALVEAAVPRGMAAAYLEGLEATPMIRAVRRGGAPPVERRPYPGATALFRDHWETSTAVVLTDFQVGWSAGDRWTPQWLRERFGDCQIEAIVGRESDPDYDINFTRHRAPMTMAAYVDRVLAQPESNDIYLIANNRNLQETALAALLDDVVMPDDLLDRSAARGSSALWFGPGGTVTPLHHDTSNILLCQVYGRKRVRLVAPDAVAAWDHARGLYSRLDPEEDSATFEALGGQTVEIGPGDTLFLPVGWWHHVRALDVSISVALNSFVRPNAHDWYKPGVGSDRAPRA